MSADAATPVVRPGLSRNGAILLGVTGLLIAAMAFTPSRFLVFPLVLAGWVTSVAVHEFGHAFAAWKAGDHSVRERGYLTFDPLKYTDLSTSLIIPIAALALGGIGFPGGAVYLREDLMRSRLGRSIASLAGPLGTLLCLAVLAVAVQIALIAGAGGLVIAFGFLAFLQATALVINLLPIPGLDGFGVIRPWLPRRMRRTANRIGAIAGLILLVAIFFLPGASEQLLEAGVAITDLFAVPRSAIAEGHDTFTFWN